ncbi:MAG: VCBS repeat-containing protein, partial [Caldilineaceae bacterium]|nr:VCBS repeat-containing protein [Caldilineaceae bacterium]
YSALNENRRFTTSVEPIENAGFHLNRTIDVQNGPGLLRQAPVETFTLAHAASPPAEVETSSNLAAPVANMAAQVSADGPIGLSTSPGWSTVVDGGSITSMAWGDVDGDGDVDLAIGGDVVTLYLNERGVLTPADWAPGEVKSVESLAWGDADGDQKLDLAVAGYGYVEIYRNEGAKLASVPTWSAVELGGVVHSLAWGDVNGDRLPDLAVGAEGSSGVYLNLADGLLSETPYWLLPELQWTTSVAWGDVNYDGKLDLALSGFGHDMSCDCYRHEVVIYLNVDGVLQNPMYIPIESNAVYSIAWRDINRDGYPELAVATGSQAAVYINARGVLTSTKAWRPAESDSTSVVAWQDVDGDGDADLTTGNAGVNRIYRNDNGELQPQAIWTSGVDDYITSIAWGDVDGDGDPDLAAAIYGYDEECECSASTIQIYFTERTILQTESVWNPSDLSVYSIAWGDVDRDGDLDLAVGNYGDRNQVYKNENGSLVPAWESVERFDTTSVAWGDVDGDGDLDL